jgi:adenylate cyclase
VSGEDRAHTFLFADLAGYTALTEAMGDTQAADLAHEFYGATEQLAADFGAERVKMIGDAVLLRGDDPAAAVDLALCLVHDVGGRHFFPTVRAGMNTGPAVERAGDWFGSTVNLAARVAAEAAGDEVLVTAATRDAAGTVARVEFRERGRRTLRNVPQPVILYAAVREGARTAEDLAIDPVCRMAVDPEKSAGRLVFADTEFYFCSIECVQKFVAAPERYVAV